MAVSNLSGLYTFGATCSLINLESNCWASQEDGWFIWQEQAGYEQQLQGAAPPVSMDVHEQELHSPQPLQPLQPLVEHAAAAGCGELIKHAKAAMRKSLNKEGMFGLFVVLGTVFLIVLSECNNRLTESIEDIKCVATLQITKLADKFCCKKVIG